MKIAILGGDGDTTNIVYNYLSSKIDIGLIIIEKPTSKKVLIKRRIKKLGVLPVAGQIVFIIFAKLILQPISKKRINSIISNNFLNITNADIKNGTHISSEIILPEIFASS